MEGFWLVSYVVLWMLLIALGALTLSLARLVGQLHQRLGPTGALVTDQGPEIGERFDEVIEDSGLPAMPELVFPKGLDALLVFVTPNCTACDELARHLGPFASRYREKLTLYVISKSKDIEKNGALAPRFKMPRDQFLISPQLAKVLRVEATPFGVWINPDGVIRAKGIINHIEHLESLLNASDSGYSTFSEYAATLSVDNA